VEARVGVMVVAKRVRGRGGGGGGGWVAWLVRLAVCVWRLVDGEEWEVGGSGYIFYVFHFFATI
jgi:hypothetical protein